MVKIQELDSHGRRLPNVRSVTDKFWNDLQSHWNRKGKKLRWALVEEKKETKTSKK